MRIPGNITRQTILFSLIAIIAPMVAFPEMFGTSLAKASLTFALGELVFYALVVFILNPRLGVIQVAQAAGLCLGYRLVLGAAFGLSVVIPYSYEVTNALSMGLSNYVPGIALHVVATPLILRPIIRIIYYDDLDDESREAEPEPARATQTAKSAARPTMQPTTGHVEPADTAGEPAEQVGLGEPVRAETQPRAESQPQGALADLNGFERATRYIGEHASVQVATVVDPEGLTMARFERGEDTADQWAPFAQLFMESTKEVLRRARRNTPERIDLTLKEQRVVIAQEGGFSLMVIAERHSDDLLNIRINQGLDTIRKYVAEKYGHEVFANPEYDHV
jgi:predicted regulator of Ras-like GTPase activity (Roadblock/LC7/MglB family)